MKGPIVKTWFSFGLAAGFALAGVEPLGAGTPPVPKTPAAVRDVLYASPFTIAQPYHHDWRKERPLVQSGFLIVLNVNPDLVFPRQVAEPVLYVGSQTAERLNVGYPSGRVVALVPGPVDLTRDPIWFGTPQLPEQVDAATIQVERAKAEAAGITAKPPAALAAAFRQKVDVADKWALLREAGVLVQQYSPQETALAETLLSAGVR